MALFFSDQILSPTKEAIVGCVNLTVGVRGCLCDAGGQLFAHSTSSCSVSFGQLAMRQRENKRTDRLAPDNKGFFKIF